MQNPNQNSSKHVASTLNIVGKHATLTLSNPEDIFGNENTDTKFTELLYKDALKNADLRRIEFKEIARSLGVRENDFMVVFGDRVEKFFRTKKPQTHQREFWKTMDENLQHIVNNHILYKDDHPIITSEDGSLEQLKNTTMQYFRNIGGNSTDIPIQGKKAKELHLKRLNEQQLAKEQSVIPKEQRIEIKPYNFIEPERRKPIIQFQDTKAAKLESQAVFFGGDKSKVRDVPFSYIEPPKTYKEHFNPTDDQLTHPFISPQTTSKKFRKSSSVSHTRPMSAGTVSSKRQKSKSQFSNVTNSAHFNNIGRNQFQSLSRSTSRKSIQRTSSFHVDPSKVLLSREGTRRRISFQLNTNYSSSDCEELSPKPDSPTSRDFSQMSSFNQKIRSPGRIRLKEPIDDNIIERVALARQAPKSSKTIYEEENTVKSRRRPSVFLTELEPSPSKVIVLNTSRDNSNEHNLQSKNNLKSLYQRKNFPRGVTSFPTEELQESNARIKSAKSGKIFVNKIVKLPDLDILFPDIPLKKKRNLQTYVSLSIKVAKLGGKKTAVAQDNDMSELEAEKNRELEEKYIRECQEIDQYMTQINQQIIDMCEKKDITRSEVENQITEEVKLPSATEDDLDSPKTKEVKLSTTSSSRKATRINPSNWKLHFGASQLQSQYKLLSELDQRHLDRSIVYKSRFHLNQVVNDSLKNASSWSLCRASSKDGYLWKKYRRKLQDDEENLHQAAMFYGMLTTFCHTHNIPDSDNQKIFVDRIRFMLMNEIKSGHSFFLNEDILFCNMTLPILQDRKNIKLINWMRSVLSISMSSFFHFIEERGWKEEVHSDLKKMLTEVKRQSMSMLLK